MSFLQVKDVLFEPVRKAQDAMHFYKSSEGMWLPCGPRHPGAIQTTLQELAAKGLAAKVCVSSYSAVVAVTVRCSHVCGQFHSCSSTDSSTTNHKDRFR